MSERLSLSFLFSLVCLLGACEPPKLPLATPPLVPCGGAPEARTLGIEPVKSPTPYSLSTPCPGGAFDPSAIWQCAADTADLEGLIAAAPEGHKYNIILEGTYTPDGLAEGFDYLRLRGHRLWARDMGTAVLHFGVDAGGNNEDWAGGELHGLVIELGDDQHAFRVVGTGDAEDITAAVATWGAGGVGVLIEDCVIRGPGVNLPQGVQRGIWAAQTVAFRARRLRVDGFLRFGVFVDDGLDAPLVTLARLWDLHIRNVGDSIWHATACDPDVPPAQQSCGTQEHGLWVGDTAVVRRVRVREVAHSGIVTAGSANGAILEHLDVDRTDSAGDTPGATGIGIERTTRNTAFRRFCIGPETRWGFKSEWDHNAVTSGADVPGPLGPRGLFNSIADGLIESSWVGVNFDQGTVDSSVERVTIRGYERAGIAMFRNVSKPLDYQDSLPTVADYLANQGGSQQDNIFQDADGSLATDAEDAHCRFTRGHVNTPPLHCESP